MQIPGVQGNCEMQELPADLEDTCITIPVHRIQIQTCLHVQIAHAYHAQQNISDDTLLWLDCSRIQVGAQKMGKSKRRHCILECRGTHSSHTPNNTINSQHIPDVLWLEKYPSLLKPEQTSQKKQKQTLPRRTQEYQAEWSET